MKLLVDTHIFLWIILSSKKIPKKFKEILLNPENTKIISTITFWEIALKYHLGKLDLTGILPESLPSIAKESGFEVLDLEAETASTFYRLPSLKNTDPFDRMLIWQAINKDLYLMTKDPEFVSYRKCGLKIIS